ncbi:hypothetical protein [Streptomyces sp. 184]|uniref:hypothetical protein n=1 Tax=Streptomyces sp. 184 TaxID=1827526 RepID=UPI0038914A63
MSFGQGGGYGGPGGQGQGSGFGPPGSGGPAPDWSALADSAAAERRRKRRLLTIVGGALATVVIAGAVAAAVVTTSGGDDDPSSGASDNRISGAGSESGKGEPSFSSVAPPPNPRDFIASADKDTAPLTVDSFYPNAKITVDGHTYERRATHSTDECASGASTKLGKVLTANDCERLLRATFTRDGTAVTVGVAVFAAEGPAGRAAEQASGNLESLPGAGVPEFCRATACRLTSNTLGRYAYFTIAGYSDGKAVTTDDRLTKEAVQDTGWYVYRRIMDRGREQALKSTEQ